MADTNCRIGKVTLKGGCHLVVLSTNHERRMKIMQDRIANAVESSSNIAGFALVLWDEDGGSITASMSSGRIPTILVPDFCRSRLLGHVIENWAVQTVNEQWGG